MRKIISIILAFCMAWSGNLFAANAAVKAETETADFDFLRAVGILSDTDIEALNTDRSITRGEFINYAMKLLNIEFSDENGQGFWDVDKTNKYYAAINAAKAMGISGGYSDGGFHANEYISSEEAMAIIVNILGYKEYAGYRGGYPEGYFAAARYLKIQDSFNFGKNITGKDVMNIFCDIADTTVLETYGINGSLTMDDTHQKSLLNSYWDIWCVEGIVNADSIGGLYANDDYAQGRFKIGDLTFYGNTNASDRYVGYNTECYYKEINGKKEVAYLKRKDNDVLKISLDDFCKTSGNDFYYYAENGRKKMLQFNYETAFLYNGRAIDYGKDYGDKLFEGDTGEIILIENSGDKYYDTVYINVYNDMPVNAVDTDRQMVFGMDKKVLGFDNKRDDENFLIYDTDKNPVRIEDLAKWDILTYTVSKDGKYIYAVASYEKKSGKVSNWIKQSDGTEMIELGDEKYESAYDCYRDKAVVSYIGKNVTLRFNCYSKVAALETGTGNLKDYFGLCIGAKTKSDLSSKGGSIYILDTP